MTSSTGDIAQKLDQLPPEKRALLQQWLKQQKRAKPAGVPTIPRLKPDDDSPLSSAQQRLWLFTQLEPENPAYHNIITMRLQGPLQVQALEQGLRTIIERHEALRTQFKVVDGNPVQRVVEQWHFKLSNVDVRSHPANALKTLLTEAACRSFDLTRDLMLRGLLMHLGDQSYVLQLVMHHIVSDGRSMQVLTQELQTLYAAYSTGKSPSLPNLLVQYGDFAQWEQQHASDKLDQQLNYWKKQLAGIPPLLDIPGDYPRPAKQTLQGALLSFSLPHSLRARLQQLAQQTGTTLFMTLLSAFKILLYRYTQQTDIVVGSPISNRNRHELENLIGFFTNTVVLRTNLSNNPSFRDLLGRVKSMALDAYSHQNLPFEKLVEALQPERNLSYGQIVQVLFVMQPDPLAEVELEGLHIQTEQCDTGTTKLDLTLSIFESGESLTGFFEYSTDLFEATTIQRMADHYQELLEGIVVQPDQTIDQLPLLTAAEQQQMISWNSTQVAYVDDCIHHRFEQQAEQTPLATAICQGTHQLTYDTLNAKANQLAHYLQSLGVGPETLVGICLDRSVELVIAILAVLKAGGAYVPIDPTYPTDRIAHIINDCQTKFLLTQAPLTPQIQIPRPIQVVCLDSDQTAISQAAITNPTTVVTPQNLAYVMYTSGSTGQPKGVMVEHSSLVNFIAGALDNYGITARDRILQFASIGFDIAVEEIFSALTAGSTLVLRNQTMISSTKTFLDTCREWHITLLDLPTAYWHQLVNDIVLDQLDIPDCIRLVIIGGERVMLKQVQQWHQLSGHVPQLINTYGPTETTVVATSYRCTPYAVAVLQQDVPIGKPVSNVQTHVLSPSLQPLPVGIPGDLYIGGVGLARGYFNRPNLTAERFITAPWDKSQRLYKTGDLVRYNADGHLEFLGRLDSQVKLRGFRIELGEIEATLCHHPAVKETVVCKREDQPGNPQLVAYVISSGQRLDPGDLRQIVQQALPSYMVPSAFVQLDMLPLTPNGKINYRELPKPTLAHVSTSVNSFAPRTTTEASVANIWSNLLNLEAVGIDDNFFDLGGHSLLATQVVSRIQQTLQVDITLRQLFESPTVATLADRLDTLLWAKSAPTPALKNNRQEGEL